MTACWNPGASGEIPGLARTSVCTIVSKVLAVLSNHFLNYHHGGAFLSCVCIILMCVEAKYVCVCVCVCVCARARVRACVTAWQVSTGLLFLSYLIINLLI